MVAVVVLGGLNVLVGIYWPDKPDPNIEDDNAGQVAIHQRAPQEVARGSAIYEANCVQCHGPHGAGSPNWKERNPEGTYRPPPHD